MIALPLLALLAQSSEPPVPRQVPVEVVVTAPSLRALEQALRECVGRDCPVDRDVELALALAEAQFAAGEYRKARRTLRAASGRVRGRASDHPVPVSDLWRAASRIGAHLGELEEYRWGAGMAYRTLRDAFGEGDARALVRRLDMAEALTDTGLRGAAERTFEEAIAAAERAGAPETAAQARLRYARAMVNRALARENATVDRDVAWVVAPLLAATSPELAGWRFAARLLLARLAERRGEKGATQAVLRDLPAGLRTLPVLLESKPVRLREEAIGQPFEDQWVDLEFWIGSDGRVADLQPIAQSGRNFGDWVDRVMTSIRSRRYAPSAAGGPVYRVERYTLTSRMRETTGSRIRVRGGDELLLAVDRTRGRSVQELLRVTDRTPGAGSDSAPSRP